MSTRNSSATASRRQLLSLSEIRDIVNDVDSGLEALLELLWQSQNNVIHPESVHILLKPLSNKLCEASCDLNDMSL